MSIYALHTATNYRGTMNALRGCINDWKNMLQLDDYLEIPQENRISLVGANFKREMAVQAVDHFSSLMESGDILIGSNSSHGTYIIDEDGDEYDKRDEAIVDNDCNLILDDDIYLGLKKFKEDTLVFAWLDNCHAGTMDRAFQRQNWHLTASDIKCNVVLLLGCAEDAYSADAYIGGQYQGALTTYSLKVIRDANYDLTYRELLEKTNEALRKNNYEQVAKMAISSEKLLDKKIFTF